MIEKALLDALDKAIERDPNNAALRRRRTEVLDEIGDVRKGGDLPELQRRLEECEKAMLTSKDGELLKEHERLTQAILRESKKISGC